MKQILNSLLLGTMAVDQVFGGASENNLPSDADGGIFLETDRRLLLIPVVEDDRDTGFRYSGLAAFIDKILETRSKSARETRAQEFG